MKVKSLFPSLIFYLLVGVFCVIALSGSYTPIKAETRTYQTTQAFAEYQPQYKVILAHTTNYGDRYSTDFQGNILYNQPLAVLHETVGSARSAINLFLTPHYEDSKQVSYHTLITLDGTIIYIVPPEKRAFGAGNSVFRSSLGEEAVQTNPQLAASVNNFAYHISLETPIDGRNNRSSHSGYTEAQYKSLAWLLAMSNIPYERITSHQNVDLSGQKNDPRSFDFTRLFAILDTFRQPSVEP